MYPKSKKIIKLEIKQDGNRFGDVAYGAVIKGVSDLSIVVFKTCQVCRRLKWAQTECCQGMVKS